MPERPELPVKFLWLFLTFFGFCVCFAVSDQSLAGVEHGARIGETFGENGDFTAHYNNLNHFDHFND